MDTSCVAVFDCDFLDAAFVPYLTLLDLSHFESVHPRFRDRIAKGSHWHEVAFREVSSFTIEHALWKTTARLKVKELLSQLRRASTVEGSPIALSSFTQAWDLARSYAKAEERASRHLRSGGQVAQVFVGRFHFAEGTVDAHTNIASTFRQLSGIDMRFSKPLTCSIERRTGMAPTGGRDYNRQGLPIDITLAYDRLAMVLRAQVGSAVEHSSMALQPPKTLQFDVHALSSAVLLQMRDVNVRLGGLARGKGSGIFAPKVAKHLADAELADGLLCVVSVRDSIPAGSLSQSAKTVVEALHIDERR